MKALTVMLCLFLLAVTDFSQVSVGSPDSQYVLVIESNWNVTVRNPALDEDPMKAVNDTKQAIRDQREVFRQEALRAQIGLPPEPRSTRTKVPEAARQAPPTAIYTYKIKVKNNGEKPIQSLVWDYVFYEPGTNIEVGRQRFKNEVSIAPGKTKVLSSRTSVPPTGSINAAHAGKNSRSQFSEQIFITEIQYDDNSIWKAAENPEH